MITTSYICPDGKSIICTVWTQGNNDAQTYNVTKDCVQNVYPDMPLDEAIRLYAIAKFTLFHDVQFNGRFMSRKLVEKTRSL